MKEIRCEEWNGQNDYYGYVYITLDQKRNLAYVGQKKGLVEDTTDYFGSGTRIIRIIKNRGKYFLDKNILGVCFNKEDLTTCETECKLFFNTLNSLYGYNIIEKDYSPMYGRKHTKESKQKMSDNLKGEKHPNWGKPLSEETKKKIGIKSS